MHQGKDLGSIAVKCQNKLGFIRLRYKKSQKLGAKNKQNRENKSQNAEIATDTRLKTNRSSTNQQQNIAKGKSRIPHLLDCYSKEKTQ